MRKISKEFLLFFFSVIYSSHILRLLNLPKELSWILILISCIIIFFTKKVKFNFLGSILLFFSLILFYSPNIPDYFTTIIKITLCFLSFVFGQNIAKSRYKYFFIVPPIFFIIIDILQRIYSNSSNILMRVFLGPLDYKKLDISIFTDSNFTGIIGVFILTYILNLNYKKKYILVSFLVILIFFSASKSAWIACIILVLFSNKLFQNKILLILLSLAAIIFSPFLLDTLSLDPSGSDKVAILQNTFFEVKQDPLKHIIGFGYELGSIQFVPSDHFGHNFVSLVIGVNGLIVFIMLNVYLISNFSLKTMFIIYIVGLSYLPIHNEFTWYLLGAIYATEKKIQL